MERSPRKTRGLPLGRIHPGLLIAAPQANRLAGVLAPEEEFLLHLREPPVQGEFHQEAPVGPVIRPMQRRLAENVGPDEAEYIEAWRRVENDVPEPFAGILRPGDIDSPRPEPGNATAIDAPVQARVVGKVAPEVGREH